MSDEELSRAAKFLRAMADASRLAILSVLDGEATVTDIARATKMPLSTVSQHLRALRDQEIVKRRRDGKKLIYSVASGDARAVLDVIRVAATARPLRSTIQ